MSEPINERGEPIGAPEEQLDQAIRGLSQIGGEPVTEQGSEPEPYRQISEQMRGLDIRGGFLRGTLYGAVALALLGGVKLGEKLEKYGKKELKSIPREFIRLMLLGGGPSI